MIFSTTVQEPTTDELKASFWAALKMIEAAYNLKEKEHHELVSAERETRERVEQLEREMRGCKTPTDKRLKQAEIERATADFDSAVLALRAGDKKVYLDPEETQAALDVIQDYAKRVQTDTLATAKEHMNEIFRVAKEYEVIAHNANTAVGMVTNTAGTGAVRNCTRFPVQSGHLEGLWGNRSKAATVKIMNTVFESSE